MILILNAGSSSLKFSLFDDRAQQEFITGNIERIGQANSFISFAQQGKSYQENLSKKIKNHTQALQVLFSFFIYRGYNLNAITKIGHRVVHGGDKFWQPVKINLKVIGRLKSFSQLAPLHNPVSIHTIELCKNFFPRAVQYACFDTEWYRFMTPEHFLYALPKKYYTKHHIRQYGFHGLSHEQAAQYASRILKKPLAKINIITCHLGAGSSITVVKNGRAIETSMGFTPLSGLSMSSRVGDLDANIPLYMCNQLRLPVAKVFEILNTKSGWLALSGVTDFRQIMVDCGYKIKGFAPRKKTSARHASRLVLTRFINEVSFYIAGYTSLLPKVDAVVFTGAIGNNPEVRKLIRAQLSLKNAKYLHCVTDEQQSIVHKIKNLH